MGKTERSNGASSGRSDIEGKAARVAARELGTRTSFKWAGAHESTRAANEFQNAVNFWGTHATRCWFESLAIASRPLQRRLAETIFLCDLKFVNCRHAVGPLILLISLCTFAAFAGEIREFNLQNQFIGAACNVKRWPRLLAQ